MRVDLTAPKPEVLTKDELESDAMLNLIAAMLRLTAQDIRLGSDEAKEFLYSEWFETICDGLRVDIDHMRKAILNDKIKSRTTYE
jgi:myosin heavy subunit